MPELDYETPFPVLDSMESHMESHIETLKVGFIPFAAPGHMIPLMDMARVFARQGADVTYFTTTANAIRFQDDVESDFKLGYNIKIHTLRLPCVEVGLPPGLESFNDITSMEGFGKLWTAFSMLENEIEQLLSEMKADCIISDTIHSWTLDAATRLGIPRLVFQSAGYMAQSFIHCTRHHKPYENVKSDTEPFMFPGLPHKIEMTRQELPDFLLTTNKTAIEGFERIQEMERKSHGVLMNTFYELEPDYVKYYESSIGLKSWAIGPVSLWNKKDVPSDNVVAKSEIIEWLDTKESNSVLYVSFGSMTRFPDTQLLEIAHALENSGHQFIWVVGKKVSTDEKGYLPEGFEERMEQGKKGLIIRNWAPQILILNHKAIGGFVTHCGWNSILESVCAGQPIISWPLTAEQFYNEKFVTDVVKIAMPVGSKKWWDMNHLEELEIINRKKISNAIIFLMNGGKEVQEMRKQAKELSFAATKAISTGGSSHANLLSLIHELKSKSQRQN